MNYKDLEKKIEDFRRLTGVLPSTFEKMIEILAVSYQNGQVLNKVDIYD